MGTSLAYMTASSLYRMTRPPLVIGGLAMWVGFVKSMLSGTSRYPDREFRRFLNRYQWSCLFRGKQRATDSLNARQETVWRKNHPESARGGDDSMQDSAVEFRQAG